MIRGVVPAWFARGSERDVWEAWAVRNPVQRCVELQWNQLVAGIKRAFSWASGRRCGLISVLSHFGLFGWPAMGSNGFGVRDLAVVTGKNWPQITIDGA